MTQDDIERLLFGRTLQEGTLRIVIFMVGISVVLGTILWIAR